MFKCINFSYICSNIYSKKTSPAQLSWYYKTKVPHKNHWCRCLFHVKSFGVSATSKALLVVMSCKMHPMHCVKWLMLGKASCCRNQAKTVYGTWCVTLGIVSSCQTIPFLPAWEKDDRCSWWWWWWRFKHSATNSSVACTVS